MNVADLGFGTAPLAGLFAPVAEQDAQAALRTAYTAGIRAFDTAPHYGGGLAEERLGRFLRTVRRDDCEISTKVGRVLESCDDEIAPDRFVGGHRVRRRFDFSRDGVMRSLESSMTRLGVDRVEVAYLHDPESAMDAAMTTGLATLYSLKDEGVVGAVGVGTNIVDVARRFVDGGDIDVVMLAGRLTLLDQSGLDLVESCAQRSIGVHAAGIFNSGILAAPVDGARFDYKPAGPEILSRARAIAAACIENGFTLNGAAVQYASLFSAVERTVLGLRSVSEVEAAVASAVHIASEALWSTLEGMRIPMPNHRPIKTK
ncbi:aldo/keto reductase [Microbacterium sp. CIAB417]|uniref:aldo/keto reductase n=1 Tax=Microbacterium sp. CIAB417 TaxID=2860287 RepID=UPI001FADDAE3|nr:aldo/keto reductase [Microbacterium sp. CIAB417]